jgi:hypothetical protein
MLMDFTMCVTPVMMMCDTSNDDGFHSLCGTTDFVFGV